ncbi:MAG: hypothetical protein EKK48_31050 [Candidatus Melainabacteria bacterium]|nr:MAG: hypothetical protein EKK48_31050 [Candidatus Melainabacteria bacterium]
MTNLVGGVGTFEGDPQEQVWITVDAICASCTEADTDVPPFLRAVVGDACPGIYVSKLEALQLSQDAYQEILNAGMQVDPCTFLAYFAPLVFRGDFNVSAPGAEETGGTYLVSATWLLQDRIRVFPIPTYNCWETIERNRTVMWAGAKPVEVSAAMNPEDCRYGPNTGKILVEDGYLSVPGEALTFIKPGTMQLEYLGPLVTVVSAPDLANGETGMPIPPIPSGYPAPPPPVPQPVNIVLDPSMFSDELCHDIVDRGDGFQSLSDIADYYHATSWDEATDYAVRTNVPNHVNMEYTNYVLGLVDPSFWNVLVNGTGSVEPTITLQGVAKAFDTADDTTKKAFLTSVQQQINFLDVWHALALGGTETLVREATTIILKEVTNAPPVLIPEVVLNEAAAATTLVAETSPLGALYLTLTLGADLLKKSTTQVDQIISYECDGELRLNVVADINDDMGLRFSNVHYMQLVMDKLNQLLQCCNPCPETLTQPDEQFLYWGHLTSHGEPPKIESPTYLNISGVLFHVSDNLFPKVYEFGPPELSLLAKFAWRFKDGSYSEIEYVNMDKTSIKAPNEDVVGFMCHCYPGVVLNAEIYTRQPWFPPNGNYGNVNPRPNPYS